MYYLFEMVKDNFNKHLRLGGASPSNDDNDNGNDDVGPNFSLWRGLDHATHGAVDPDAARKKEAVASLMTGWMKEQIPLEERITSFGSRTSHARTDVTMSTNVTMRMGSGTFAVERSPFGGWHVVDEGESRERWRESFAPQQSMGCCGGIGGTHLSVAFSRLA
jgi:hypothetical protein